MPFKAQKFLRVSVEASWARSSAARSARATLGLDGLVLRRTLGSRLRRLALLVDGAPAL